MGRLFGTDGVRGKANVELTCERALQIGRAAAAVLIGETHKKPMGTYWKRYKAFFRYA